MKPRNINFQHFTDLSKFCQIIIYFLQSSDPERLSSVFCLTNLSKAKYILLQCKIVTNQALLHPIIHPVSKLQLY